MLLPVHVLDSLARRPSLDDEDLEDDGQNAVNAQETPQGVPWYDRPVSPDWVLVLGFVMCASGYISKQVWFTFGGVLLFLFGIFAIGGIGRYQGEGGEPKTP